jgi:hypothetical protein
MESQLPTFAEVDASLRSPKPPLSCRVIELKDGSEKRSARVYFDGLSGWFIEDDARVEFRSSDDRVLLDEGGVLRALPGAHSNAWVKTPIQGALMSLDRSTGRVIGHAEVDGRSANVAEFTGLRSGEETVFVFHVDVETGVVLQMSRDDMGDVLRVEELRVGIVEEPLGS